MSTPTYKRFCIHYLPKSKTKKSRIKRLINYIVLTLCGLLVFIAAYLPLTYRWSKTTWSDLSMEEIIFHLTMPMDGTGGGMIMGHVLKCLLPAIIIALAFIIAFLYFRNFITYTGIMKGIAASLSVVIIACTICSFWKGMDVSAYVESQSTYSSFMDQNYVDPGTVSLTFPEKKRNLIYIFLESTENTFSDKASGGAFEKDVHPELTKLSMENENFSGGQTTLDGGVPMMGATWTMGGMFAQTCGLPLTIPIDKNAMDSQDEFFPGATAIGDILEDEGYNQTLLLGSDATFGGRKLYFTGHGNYSMKDYGYYTGNGTLPSDYYVWWGYEDKYLFENAKNELNEMSKSDEPFNLTMLTVDTHFEDGYVCSECKNDFEDQYSNVYACASRQVNDFVEWVKQQPFYEDTTIVISGDHLTMDSNFCSDHNVTEDYQRKVVTTVINGAASVEEPKFREYSTFDMFPTTLAALGVTIPGNKLALGVNLYSSEETLLEKYGKDAFNQGLSSKSQLMENLTAGIATNAATITPLGYDSTTKTMQVVAKDISTSENMVSLMARVMPQGDNSEIHEYVGENRGDGSYIFTIPFQDFLNRTDKYIFNLFARNKNIADVNLGTVNLEFNDPNFIASDATKEGNQNLTGIKVDDMDYSTGKVGIHYYTGGRNDVIGVTFSLWRNEDQSDLRNFESVLDENGAFSSDIDMFELGFDNRQYNVNAFVIYQDGTGSYQRIKSFVVQ